MSNGPVFVERIDYEAAAEYLAAQGCELSGIELAIRVIDSGLLGVREAKTEEQADCLRCGEMGRHDPEWQTERRFVTEWEEVEK